MGKVTTGATMSLDGFIADADHGGHDQGLRRQRRAPVAAERAPRRVEDAVAKAKEIAGDKDAPVELDGPISVTQGKGVTHLGYLVVRK